MSKALIVIILFFAPLFSSTLPVPDKLKLKSGQELEFQISEVQPTALLNESSVGVKLSLIDTIFTTNQEVLEQLLVIYPRLEYRLSGVLFVIETGKLIIPLLESTPFDPLEYQHVLFNLTSEHTGQFEMSLAAIPWFDKSIILNAGASYGRWGSNPRFSSMNLHLGFGVRRILFNRMTHFILVYHEKRIVEYLNVNLGNRTYNESQNVDLYRPGLPYFGLRVTRQTYFGDDKQFTLNYGLQLNASSKVPNDIYFPISFILGAGYDLRP